MNSAALHDAAVWAAAEGWTDPEPVRGGTNNRLYRVWGERGSAALKIYYRGSNDPRDRFGAEQDFYALCARGRLAAVPARLAADKKLGAAIFEWIEGESLQLPIGSADLAAASAFLRKVNEICPAHREGARIASEACFGARAHFALLDRRLEALGLGAEGVPELEAFVRDDIGRLRHALGEKLLESGGNLASSPSQRIFSPGDFGFHNALRRPCGSLAFFDFEYSGWDDPVKTVADIFLQPEKPVGFSFLPEFCSGLPAYPALYERVRRWMPFFALKWCCILLNPAVARHADRRNFSGEGAGAEVVSRQLEKARRMFGRAEEAL